VITTIVLAASEPSKVPFFIAGGAIAAWAVVLAALGLSRATFPFNVRGERAVIAVSVVLAVIAMAMAIVTSK
jgi:hypothetical protein